MLTIIESPLFSSLWPDYWTEADRGEFASFLAATPDAGDLIPGSGGCRKIRWGVTGRGKRGGVRVIYTLQLASGVVVLLTIYSKNATENIPSHILKQIAEELGYAS
jgi:mRNA-degrading endonuclease RelE of RelBE toxin-antitoxin system